MPVPQPLVTRSEKVMSGAVVFPARASRCKRLSTMSRREVGLTIFSLIFQLSAENMRWLC